MTAKFRMPDPRFAILALAAAFALALPAAADARMVFPDGDITREGRGNSGATVTWATPTVSGGSLRGTPNCTPRSGSAFPTGLTKVDCIAVVEVCPVGPPAGVCLVQPDGGSFNVRVTPGAGPELSGLGDVSAVAAPGRDSATVDYALPRASDPSGVAAGSIACAPAPGSEFPVGDTTVTCGARDTVGNESSATFRVSVAAAPAAPGLPSAEAPAAPGAGDGAGGSPAAPPRVSRAVVLGRGLRVSRGVAVLAVTCPKDNPVACRGTVKLETARAVATKAGAPKRRLRVAAKRIALEPGRKATLRLRLGRAARRATTRRGHLGLRAVARTADQAGGPLTATRAFKVKLARR